MSKLTNYKLTPAGEAYKKAAEDDKKPHKGIIHVGGKTVDIRNLDDDSAKLIELTPYVEKVDKAEKKQ